MVLAIDGFRGEQIVPGFVELLGDDRAGLVGHVDLTGDAINLLGGFRAIDDGETLRRDELVGNAQQVVEGTGPVWAGYSRIEIIAPKRVSSSDAPRISTALRPKKMRFKDNASASFIRGRCIGRGRPPLTS